MSTFSTGSIAFANKVTETYGGTIKLDISDLAAGAEAATTISFPGVYPGDIVLVGHQGIGMSDAIPFGNIGKADLIRVGVANLGSSALDSNLDTTCNFVVLKV